MIDYAKKVKEYRERTFMTQKELAAKLGVGLASVIRWEQGQFKPTIKVQKKLVALFKEEGMEIY